LRSLAARVLGYALEYGAALFWELWIFFRPGFAIVNLANPPDTLCPELYETKFGRKGGRAPHDRERWSVRVADVVISTNDLYRRMAVQRDGKDPCAKAALSLQLNKTDQNDARGLAQIVRTGIVRSRAKAWTAADAS
jgi:hypothetical protein